MAFVDANKYTASPPNDAKLPAALGEICNLIRCVRCSLRLVTATAEDGMSGRMAWGRGGVTQAPCRQAVC